MCKPHNTNGEEMWFLMTYGLQMIPLMFDKMEKHKEALHAR